MPESFEIALPDGLIMRGAIWRGGPKTPALCIPGLTRNARDFADLAERLAPDGRDFIALSLRGRATSDYDPDYLNYNPLTYRQDVLAALDRLALRRAAFIGTSLGGIVTMLVNEAAPDRVAGAVLNDVGPELAAEGLARITGYAGVAAPDAADLDAAADRIRAVNEVAFPDRDPEFWRAFAERTYRREADGRWRLDYDPAIGAALREAGPAPDLWSAFNSLKDTPTLVIRGVLSDLLTPAIVEKMRIVRPGLAYCEVPGVGHAPLLTEPAALGAIRDFLAGLD